MTKKVWIFLIIIIIVGIWFFSLRNNSGDLTSSGLLRPSTKSTPAPEATSGVPVAPKTFQYDSSTDLEAELDKVNPEVLDSDFE
ncbi:hypothetical protein A3C59_01750 [Candidatus Daviesbacteria bacterium RIFCSPHIGHO2_02_FULL_36_13]|uniref:Uncharacterized protein n=1 Tax=Candidatus Daviesbacteria bacterium RIFCSPHIGHO2_02_FULL_36_13 TaxID=1797768 RepID=A0A1F5JWC4_9BACT|nr:MAG: hypothetical protein A3C59_01750 [Candidatus Daviesbacteria bacterium RIFCSPHIGHO2_02_FULL_36_13]OGE41025.1 MAG: hypothetical protein A3A45_03915 [Candidatus Daviesbacteria bacterium RIFCSPLOWO2_01_FULL_36_8]